MIIKELKRVQKIVNAKNKKTHQQLIYLQNLITKQNHTIFSLENKIIALDEKRNLDKMIFDTFFHIM